MVCPHYAKAAFFQRDESDCSQCLQAKITKLTEERDTARRELNYIKSKLGNSIDE